MLRRFFSNDRGVTLVELVITVAVVAAVGVIVTGTAMVLFNNTDFQLDLEQVEQETRPVLRELIIALREANDPNGAVSDHPVIDLDWDHLTFYSDVPPLNCDPNADPGPDGTLCTEDDENVRIIPDLVTYELVNPRVVNGDQIWDLQRTVVQPDDLGAATLTFTPGSGTPRIILENVIADDGTGAWGPLFAGIEWVGGVRTVIDSCSGSGCDLNLVQIRLHADPDTDQENPRVFEIFEEVRLRNA